MIVMTDSNGRDETIGWKIIIGRNGEVQRWMHGWLAGGADTEGKWMKIQI